VRVTGSMKPLQNLRTASRSPVALPSPVLLSASFRRRRLLRLSSDDGAA
jgi:hypothetical protein